MSTIQKKSGPNPTVASFEYLSEPARQQKLAACANPAIQRLNHLLVDSLTSSPDLTMSQKIPLMEEWWHKAQQALIDEYLTREVVEGMVDQVIVGGCSHHTLCSSVCSYHLRTRVCFLFQLPSPPTK